MCSRLWMQAWRLPAPRRKLSAAPGIPANLKPCCTTRCDGASRERAPHKSAQRDTYVRILAAARSGGRSLLEPHSRREFSPKHTSGALRGEVRVVFDTNIFISALMFP